MIDESAPAGPPPSPAVSDGTASPDFMGFTDLEAELLGPGGMEVARRTLDRLAALDERLAEAERAGLAPGDHAIVSALRRATVAGASILTAPPLSRR